jgi:molecular chaperone GrpE
VSSEREPYVVPVSPRVPGGEPDAGAGEAPVSAAAEPEPGPTTPEAEAGAENGHQEVGAELDELTARAAKAEEYLGLAQRTKADFENFRKRAARDAALAQERGVAKLAKALLPAIDDLDRAVQAAETWSSPAPAPAPTPAPTPAPEGEGPDATAPEETSASHEAQLHAGLKLVHAEVLAALARVGIEAFSPAGETFDPTLHEAVAQTPIEGAATGTVVEVYQQGYRLGETVLRPARVLVAA